MAWTRARRRWAWALAFVLAAVALAVPLTVARRQEPTPPGTPLNVVLEDFKVGLDTAVVPAGTVRFQVRGQGPTRHELIVVRTDRLTVNEKAPGIDLVDDIDGLDIDERQTLVLGLTPGNYVLYCNLEGHYLGGMHASLAVR